MDKITIKGGKIFNASDDLASQIQIENGKFKKIEDNFEPDVEINAEDCLVMPGLIDIHAHIFDGGTDEGVPADLFCLPNGVTTIVDGGSAGSANIEAFEKLIVPNNHTRTFAYMGLSSSAQISRKVDDCYALKYCEPKKLKYLYKKYEDNLVGIKLKQTKKNIADTGLEPIKLALNLAEELNCAINVHIIDPPVHNDELVKYFRKGDIFTHVYHGCGYTILDKSGHVLPAVLKAQERGVYFDACNGRSNFAFSTAEKAIAQGFLPDIISSDITKMTMYKDPACSLPWIMSKYLALGMPLNKIIDAVTVTPAKAIRKESELGYMEVGRTADLSIFKIIEGRYGFKDIYGEVRWGDKVFLPVMTIKNGRIVYKNILFN